jgi:hypothetical protein
MIATAPENALEIALPTERVIDPAPVIADTRGLVIALATVPTPPYSPVLVVDVSFVIEDEPLTTDSSVVAMARRSVAAPEYVEATPFPTVRAMVLAPEAAPASGLLIERTSNAAAVSAPVFVVLRVLNKDSVPAVAREVIVACPAPVFMPLSV